MNVTPTLKRRFYPDGLSAYLKMCAAAFVGGFGLTAVFLTLLALVHTVIA